MASAAVLSAVCAPAVAAPAVAWEDQFVSGELTDARGHHYIGGHPTERGSEDMFGDNYYDGVLQNSVAYVPNYVAPPAPPPPPPIYVDESGDYCREYSREAHVGDRMQENYGTACLQPDGSWRVVQ
jgi:hypothetical protein